MSRSVWTQGATPRPGSRLQGCLQRQNAEPAESSKALDLAPQQSAVENGRPSPNAKESEGQNGAPEQSMASSRGFVLRVEIVSSQPFPASVERRD